MSMPSSCITGIALLSIATTIGKAQANKSQPAPFREAQVTIQACRIARLEQLRFIVAARLASVAPREHDASADAVSMPRLTVVGATCSPLRVQLEAEVRRWSTRSADGARDTTRATVRFSVGTMAYARYRPDSAASTSLTAASLCLDGGNALQIDGTAKTLRIDPAEIRPLLTEAFADACVDITSLVYVYLRRGGTLAAAS